MQKSESYLLSEMTRDDARAHFARCDVAILPVGSTEQHGPHLPLDTDAFDAYWVSCKIAERVKPPKPAVCPPVNYGVSYHHMDFAGTISISPQTLATMVYEICVSLVHHGIKKILIINGHGGNTPALHCAAQKLNHETNAFICIDTGDITESYRHKIMKAKNDVHAGECETSTSLANREHLVRIDKIKKPVMRFPSRYTRYSGVSVPFRCRITDISSDGVLGDPTMATKNKGNLYWDKYIKSMVALVNEMKKMTTIVRDIYPVMRDTPPPTFKTLC